MTLFGQWLLYLCLGMQRLLSLLLLCGILGQATVRTAWTLHYQWNRAAYMARCINKDKPNLHCNGQCGFMKQIAAHEKSRSKAPQLPENFSEIKDIQLFFEPNTLFCLSTPSLQTKAVLPAYLAFVPEAPVSDIFRPPA